MSKRKCRMVFPFGRHVGFVCFFGAVKRAEVDVSPFNLDLRLPLAGPEVPCSHQARSAVGPGFALVVAVVPRRNIAQIAKPVVVSDPVNMINVTARPDAMNVKPSEPVFAVLPAKKTDVAVSLRACDKPGPLPRDSVLIAGGDVRENARIGTVVQMLFQEFLCECSFALSHVIAPIKRWFGQGIVAAANCFNPRYNIAEGV